jgi:8-oxo-dGTP pyrophosphatase MutT (NUDIX family)
MQASEQNVKPERYQIIPRVLIFPVQADSVLLIKLLPRQGKVTTWTGRYNGPGGHVEQGESLFSAAARELLEETGLQAELTLCGTLIVDTGQAVGIGLFIFRADHPTGTLIQSPEGIPEWIHFERIGEFPLVEDVAIIVDRIRKMRPGDPPFSGRSFYDENDRLRVVFQDL